MDFSFRFRRARRQLAVKVVRSYLQPALIIAALLGGGYLLFRRPVEQISVIQPAPAAGAVSTPAERTLEIVTLLPKDAIPAIDNPKFYSATEADEEYAPTEMVLGVSLNGESRAYSTSLLSSHEIVNDTVGGRKIAVTW